MSGNGFGRYLTDEYRGRGRSEEAAQRRAQDRAAAQRPKDSERTEDTPPKTRRLTREGAFAGEIGNERGFAKHITGDAPIGSSDAAQREAESPTAGRGFGRYLK
ncbi:hypothetical protein B7C42_03164 [Nocardia cerradoensis]|uniref:Uncharacterized protein n=1 Tax=Nocardia cerradoensis TaxID=85688 RepID=A0A231H6A2_9NOCA|nr:hypothetical protein [Nocardia cerradoensis]OXR44375.1 hypothetical protein B7C42_03164 [Nocardia cerradoensis]